MPIELGRFHPAVSRLINRIDTGGKILAGAGVIMGLTACAPAMNAAPFEPVFSQDRNCGNIRSVGTILPANYDLERYGSANDDAFSGKPDRFTPVSTILDIFKLKGDVSDIRETFLKMRDTCLYPIVRLSMYQDNKGIWQKFNPEDAYTAGRNVSQALVGLGFPESVKLVIGNEVNRGEEWGREANVEEYIKVLASFMKGVREFPSKTEIYFPPLSYSPGEGVIHPVEYFRRFGELADDYISPGSLDGIAIIVYGKDTEDIEIQVREQLQNIASAGLLKYFDQPVKYIMMETGIIADGSANYLCDRDDWVRANQPLVDGILNETHAPVRLFGCFDKRGQTMPATPAVISPSGELSLVR